MHDDLHWLDVPERIQYKTGVTVHCCLQSKAPKYITDCCTPVSEIASRHHLRSASRHHLSVPRHRLSTFGRRAFSVAGPTVWNSLPDSLRDPAISSSSFRQQLKTDFFNRYSRGVDSDSMHDFSHDKPKRIATFGTHDYLEVRCDSGSKRSKVKVAGATKWVGVGCGHWMHVFLSYKHRFEQVHAARDGFCR